jgi:protein-disulfide isomerase
MALQIGVLHAICPWCMAGHALGLALSIVIVWQVPLARRVPNGHNVAAGSADATGFIQPRRAAWLFCAGIATVGLLAAAQWLVDAPAGRTIRLPPGANADSGPGPNRRIAVIDGKFQVSPHELPVLGSADSPKLLLVLFDYCCPHCRAAHGYLNRARKTFGDELGIVLLPMPMDHKCNFTVQHTEPRFEHACELARLALAVWRADRKAFAAFDEWLLDPESPRDPAAARRKAAELVGAAALETALRDPRIDRQIAANVQAYADSGADRIPVLMSPGFSSIVGRPESERQLLETLRTELQLGESSSPADSR